MTTTFQLSDKRGDAIILVKAEDPDPGIAYQAFRVAAEDAGLNSIVEAFGQPGVTGAAIAAATAITAPPPATYTPAQNTYAPVQQQAAPGGIPGAPRCHHGPKVHRTSKPDAPRQWTGWFCPSPKGTPDQCPAVFSD